MDEMYGFSYRITKLDGSVIETGGTGYANRVQMLADWTQALIRDGYAPPQWWQFWRWKDYPRSWPRERFGGWIG